MLTSEQQATDENTPPDLLRELAQQSIELARLVAQNPAAMPDLLEELAKSDDRPTREGVATNPNTPIDELLQLGEEFPKQILANPIFSLLLLENPALPQQVPLKTLRQLIKQDDIPTSFLERYALCETDRNILLQLMMKPNISPIILQKLTQRHKDISEAAKLHINLAGEMQAGWYEAARDAIRVAIIQEYRDWRPRAEYYLYVLGWLNFIPEALLLDCVNDKNSVCRKFAATAINSNTPLAIVQRLAEDEVMDVCLAVAKNPNVPAMVLKQLVKSSDQAIRDEAQKNFNAHHSFKSNFQPLLLWIKARTNPVLKGRDTVLNWIAAFLDGTAIIILPAVLYLAFSSRDFRNSMLEHISESRQRKKMIELRRRIAWNPRTHYPALEDILKDKMIFPDIDSCTNIPDHLLRFLLIKQGRDCHDAIKKSLARPNPYYLNWVLEGYARCKRPIVRILVLLQPQMPLYVLEEKSESPVWLERYAVAQNSSTSITMLEKLAQDGNRIVRAAAKTHLTDRV